MPRRRPLLVNRPFDFDLVNPQLRRVDILADIPPVSVIELDRKLVRVFAMNRIRQRLKKVGSILVGHARLESLIEPDGRLAPFRLVVGQVDDRQCLLDRLPQMQRAKSLRT